MSFGVLKKLISENQNIDERIRKILKVLTAYLLHRNSVDESYELMSNILLKVIEDRYVSRKFIDLIPIVAAVEQRLRAITKVICLLEFLRKHEPKLIYEAIRFVSEKFEIPIVVLALGVYIVYLHATPLLEKFVLISIRNKEIEEILEEFLADKKISVESIHFGIKPEIKRLARTDIDKKSLHNLAKTLEKARLIHDAKFIHNILKAMDLLKEQIIDDMKSLSELYVEAYKIKKTLENYPKYIEDSHAMRELMRKLNQKIEKIEGVWQELLLRKYKDMTARNLGVIDNLITTPLVLKDALLERNGHDVIVLLVVDGMSFISFEFRLLPLLNRYGFKIKRKEFGLSLLPSITDVSRRAIFSGKIPQLYTKGKNNRKSLEMNILKRRFPTKVLYSLFNKSISDAISWFSDKYKVRPEQKIIAIVVQSLEKLQHGASEETMAIMNYEFARSLVMLLNIIYNKLKESGLNPLFVITSDHGLVKCDIESVELTPEELANDLGLSDIPKIEHRFLLLHFEGDRNQLESRIREIINKDVFIVKASELGFTKVKICDKTFPAEESYFIFTKGGWKFLDKNKGSSDRRILHGALTPLETLIPIVFMYKEDKSKSKVSIIHEETTTDFYGLDYEDDYTGATCGSCKYFRSNIDTYGYCTLHGEETEAYFEACEDYEEN